MYASTLPRSNWLRRASIRLAWYRDMPASSCSWAFQRTHYCIPKIYDGWDPLSWNRYDVIFFCRGWSDKISETGAEWHVDCGDVVEIETRCRIPIYGGRFCESNGMSSHSHVSHCRVLPFGKFTVTIPEPHATLQGVRIPSAILKIVFRYILFYFVFDRLQYTCYLE